MQSDILRNAKTKKNDEFYTRLVDIEREIDDYLKYDENLFRDKVVLLPCDDPEYSNFTRYFVINFERLGLKRLISTCYAPESTKYIGLFSDIDVSDDEYSKRYGKIFVLDRDNINDRPVDVDNLVWDYLDGNGDFASAEVSALRDDADFIITNPPFSKFREFIMWIFSAPKKKQFAVISTVNSAGCKDVFPFIATNQMWTGSSIFNNGMYFYVPDEYEYADSYKFDRIKDGKKVMRVPSICWYTNIDYGRRHEPLSLMTMEDNVHFNKNLGSGYQKYDNYDALDVPSVNAIPSDYNGIMGVPITFLDKFCPEQFEIVGLSQKYGYGLKSTKSYNTYREIRQDGTYTGSSGHKANGNPMLAGRPEKMNYYTDGTNEAYSLYYRIFIRHKK